MKTIIMMAALGFAAAACGGKTTVIPPVLLDDNGAPSVGCRPEGTAKIDTNPVRGTCTNARYLCADGEWVVQVPAVGPVAEICNNLDDNCDGVVDDGFDRARDEMNCGACGRICSFAHASAVCNNGVCELDTCNPGRFNVDGSDANGCEAVCVPRGVEFCDAGGEDGAVDEDCDGLVNEGCECDEDAMQACGPAGVPFAVLESPTSRCKMGFQVCSGGAFDEVCVGFVGPVAESCNGIDDDCDGVVDNGFAVGAPCVGRGICGPGVNQCTPGGAAICSTDRGGSAYAGAPETCDGLDNDCDGISDNGFPLGIRCFGQGACGLVRGVTECAPDGRDFICSTEPGGSNDQSSSEVCNDRDDDCDGARDDGIACGCVNGDVQTCGAPDALHGVGICFQGMQICAFGAWQDCFAFRAPDPVERCNGLDDDCDGETDEDIDGRSVGDVCDGEGACGIGVVACESATETMCSTEPGGRDFRLGGTVGVERCDGLDNDCDGEIDEGFGVGVFCRGFGVCARSLGTWECNASRDDAVCNTGAGGSDYRGSSEICDPFFSDEDCDGASNEGCACPNGIERTCGSSNRGECRRGTQTCAGGLWGACVGSVEPVAELCNGADDDCDGVVDEDFGVGGVCVALGACGGGVIECDGPNGWRCSVAPSGSRDRSRVESCNWLDDDCDGAVDEDFFIGAPCFGIGECLNGRLECYDDFSVVCDSNPGGSRYVPRPEMCDAALLDEDCDGAPNEGCPCVPGQTRPCGSSNVGVCRQGIQSCVATPGMSPDQQWGACVGSVEPSGETCNDLDDDCDGAVDGGFGVGGLCVALGACGNGRVECNGPVAVRCDVAPGGSRDRSRGELCNGADDDCDGLTDEDYGVGFPCDGIGQCGGGRTECADLDSVRCSTDRGGSGDQSMPESCIGLADESCDGSVNEGCQCSYIDGLGGNLGDDFSCGFNNVGVCRMGVQPCRPNGSLGSCSAVMPSPEVCNGLDDDCDGAADEGLVCGGGGPGCVPVPEVCNGVDDDCDGAVDEGGVCMCPAEVCNGVDDDCDGLVDEGSNICNLRNVDIAACSGGGCVIVRCTPNFWDCNNLDPDGCEYGCIPSGPAEICGNGLDDDCDCSVDNLPGC